MSYLSGIQNISGLEALNPFTSQKIKGNPELVDRILAEADDLKGLGEVESKKLSFSQVVKKYNKGITDAEIKAWVWYKRKMGVPMSGWDAFKLRGSITAQEEQLHDLVNAGALFYHSGELMPFSIYTFGNIYDRLLQLEKDQTEIEKYFGVDSYLSHKSVLEKAKPELLSVENPDEKERPIITAISDFAIDPNLFFITQVREEFMDLENSEELKKVNGKIERKKDREKIRISFDGETQYTLQHVFIKWLFTLNYDTDFDKSSAIDIAEYYLANRALRDDKLTKEEKAELKANARIEGERLFSKFLHEVLAFEDQQKLNYAWNRMYNGQSDINYSKVPIGFECSTRFKSGILQITDIQREGVAFMEAMGSGINAFDVGVGKTMTAIVNLAHNLYSGKCKRPIIVVPKPTYKKWMNEIIGFTDNKTGEFVSGVLSHTGITINDWFNLGTEIVGKINLMSAVPERSITMVTYEGFKRLGFGQSVSDELFTELVNILGQSKEKSSRDKEIEYQKFREMIGVGLKNSIADIDILGFDYAVIDEAHRCKNVFSQVKSDEDGNKRYNIQSATSETGQKAFLLLSFIQRKFGRNTMLLTATPFSNSPLEIYSMLSLVAYDSLRDNGIVNLDTFFDLFVLPTVEWAANYKEEIVEKEVIKSFTNRRILQKLIYNHILYKTGEEAGVLRPKKINLPLLYNFENTKERLPQDKQVLTYINMTPKQRENQNNIVAMAKNSTKGKLDMGNLFRALAYSLDNALSPYLLNGNPEDYIDFVEQSPKINYVMECIRSVKKWHQDHGETSSGQVIYMNRGKQFFSLIKEYLITEIGYQKGIMYDRVKVDEVEIISSEINDTRKEIIKEAFLDGVVKVIIGTATIREGIDLQKRGTVIYNCYPEWNPTDIRQLEGRIWRQGNQFQYVRIVMPLIQDSMDVFVFQKLEEKTSRINDIWFRGDRGNVLDLESMDPEEIKLALITDVDRLVKMFFDRAKEELNREFKKISISIEAINEVQRDIEDYKSYREKCLEAIRSFHTSLLNSSFLEELPKVAEDGQIQNKQVKKAKELKEEIQVVLNSSDQQDKDILSLGRKIENSYPVLGIYFQSRWYMGYFKEYMSKVRKTERTILKPKGFSLSSDLAPVSAQLEAEKQTILLQSEDFKGEQNSPKWQQLRSEIEQKKSALQVEGHSAFNRAQEFDRLNYLLEYKVIQAPVAPSFTSNNNIITELELEALALEIELELINY